MIVFGTHFRVSRRLALADCEHEDEDQLQYVRTRQQKREGIRIELRHEPENDPSQLHDDGEAESHGRAGPVGDSFAGEFDRR